MPNTKVTRPATRQRSEPLSVPGQILEGLREMAEFATSGEPPEMRYTVRQLTLALEPGEYTPDKVRATREVFGLSQPLFAKFLGVEVSPLRHWEQGIRSPSAVVRRPSVPRRDERDARPLADKDRDGRPENPEARPSQEALTSGGGGRMTESGATRSKFMAGRHQIVGFIGLLPASPRNIALAGCFFVENLSGFCLQTKQLWPAELVIGTRGIEFDSFREPQLTCTLVTEGEIDYEIDQMKKHLEQVRRKAKAMLAKHKSDEARLMAEKEEKCNGDGPAARK
jgi:DNA-binding transcriptional regulator YiaG